MATWEDVRTAAFALPEVMEGVSRGSARWVVRDKQFVWERPLRAADLAALGTEAPQGPVLGVRVADLGVKAALLADAPDVCFTTPHFDNYPAILVRLDVIGVVELTELVIEAWLDRVPKRLARAYLDGLR